MGFLNVLKHPAGIPGHRVGSSAEYGIETGQMLLSELTVDFKNMTSAFVWRNAKRSSQIGDNRYGRLATSYYLYIYWACMLLEEPTPAAAVLYRILTAVYRGFHWGRDKHCADIK